jgi:hypothetical protein
MFHPDLVAQMIRLEQAERLRDAERVRGLRHRGAVGRGEVTAVSASRGCDADAA